jgi:hypothetical protein
MLETIAVSVLKAVGEKVLDSATGKATGQASDALLSKLRGDPTKKAFKQALGEAVRRYARGKPLYLAAPLLEDPGILAQTDVAKELSCLIGFERHPNAILIGGRWKNVIPDAPITVDFTKEAQLLLSYLGQSLRETDVFRPVFEAQSLEAIAATTAISDETLGKIESSLTSLINLINSAFGEMTRLFSEANPTIQSRIADFTTFIEDRTQGFVGRQFVFDAFDEFTRNNENGYFLVTGDPGIGKSAISAQLVKTRGYIHHFNIRAEGINTADIFLQNVCAQLIAVYRLEYTVATADNAQRGIFFDKLLREVSNKLEGKKAIIVIDGLDEVDGIGPGNNPLDLPLVLPSGICIFVTLRKDTKKPRAERLSTFRLTHDSALNTDDVRAYLEQALSKPGIKSYIASQKSSDADFVELMVKKSEGNFMYLRYVIPEVESGAYKDLALPALPTGLRDYYVDHWDRMKSVDREAWLSYKLPILMALTRVKLPVSIDLVAKFSGVEERPRIRGVLQDWGQFLHQELVDDAGEPQRRYRIYHESFLDFIAELDEVKDSAKASGGRAEGVDISEANRKIADVLWSELYGDDQGSS